MKKYTVILNADELGILLRAIPIFKKEVDIDKEGYIKRKMPNFKNKAEYLSSIQDTYNKLLKLSNSD